MCNLANVLCVLLGFKQTEEECDQHLRLKHCWDLDQ